jgi:hypothetical protein
MIQRIQTLYLLLGAILSGFLLFSDMAVIRYSDEIYLLNGMGYYLADGLETEFVEPNLGMSTTLFFMLLASIACILLFKNRRKQITLSMLLISISLLFNVLLFMSKSLLPASLGEGESLLEFTWIVALAVALPVLFFLAWRGIRRDELLIKSADRLR